MEGIIRKGIVASIGVAVLVVGVAAAAQAATGLPDKEVPVVTPAAITPTPTVPPQQYELRRDAILDPTFDDLAKLPGFQDGGLDSASDDIIVYWNGPLGKDAEAIIAKAKERDVIVRVVQVPYSYEELRGYAGDVVQALLDTGIETGGYTIGDPFDAIVVWGDTLSTSTAEQDLAQKIAATVLPNGLTLTVTPAPGEITFMDSRHSDGGQPTVGDGFAVTSLGGSPHCTSSLG